MYTYLNSMIYQYKHIHLISVYVYIDISYYTLYFSSCFQEASVLETVVREATAGDVKSVSGRSTVFFFFCGGQTV